MKPNFYTEEEKGYKLTYYNSLSEKQRRYFLALEYLYLGRGSQRYLAEFFNCSRQTIINGVSELQNPNHKNNDSSRQRRPGGGRKRTSERA